MSERQGAHFDDCWRFHMECAVMRCERLAARVQELERERDRLRVREDNYLSILQMIRKELTGDIHGSDDLLDMLRDKITSLAARAERLHEALRDVVIEWDEAMEWCRLCDQSWPKGGITLRKEQHAPDCEARPE